MTIHLAEQDIRQRAYELWKVRGCPEGSPKEDWHAAEQQLRADLDAVASPLSPLAVDAAASLDDDAAVETSSLSRLRRGGPKSPFEI